MQEGLPSRGWNLVIANKLCSWPRWRPSMCCLQLSSQATTDGPINWSGCWRITGWNLSAPWALPVIRTFWGRHVKPDHTLAKTQGCFFFFSQSDIQNILMNWCNLILFQLGLNGAFQLEDRWRTENQQRNERESPSMGSDLERSWLQDQAPCWVKPLILFFK